MQKMQSVKLEADCYFSGLSKINKRKINEIVNHNKIALARALINHYSVHYSNSFDHSNTREQLYSARRRLYISLKKQAMKRNKSFSG